MWDTFCFFPDLAIYQLCLDMAFNHKVLYSIILIALQTFPEIPNFVSKLS